VVTSSVDRGREELERIPVDGLQPTSVVGVDVDVDSLARELTAFILLPRR
jgi:hypothetical protein